MIARDSSYVYFATRLTAKSPYKMVAKFVQNYGDWLAFFIVIGFSVLPYWFYLVLLPYPHV